ncbi:hypothetical protein IWW55_003177 [Coemansia sp. RSA 2706]|nr:hypothetical protein IWW55_003177 [Coemansia sp. RSA 2706]KAJ2307352.1 hypothetical protein IWW54_004416 [Coemansia sp. RSA 2705]KAJ2316600.1 hypothetical protein IWW52_003566 [Coemansia sp. RSA 2704]
MLLNNDEFLTALTELFVATRENGSVRLTVKRYDFTGLKEERLKKQAKRASDEEAMQLVVEQLSLSDKEYATLVRAVTEKKKLSTLVAPADLDLFLARYHGLLLTNVDSIKKKDRARRKKKALKQRAARKAHAQSLKQPKST